MAIKKNYSNQRLEYVSKDGSIHDVSRLFEPIWHYHSLEEGKLDDYVEFERYNNGIRETFNIDTIKLSSSQTMRTELFKHRIYYRDFYDSFIQEYITDTLDVLSLSGKSSFNTEKLGWTHIDKHNGTKFVLGPMHIPNKGVIEYSDKNLKFTNGTKQNQIDFINQEILPYKETRFALVLGLSSIVASFIEEKVNAGTLVVNVSGQSSTGKSTIAELSASMYADPKTSNYGIVRTFNATKNFILGMSEGRNGVPIILDDANANANEHSKSDLIYQFALGESRGRCNSSGSTQSQKAGWSGIVIITSETPLLESENMSRGALVRTLTIDNLVWTQDAKHSNRIKSGVRANFGYIAPDIAQIIQTIGIDSLVSIHNSYIDKILAKMVKKDSFSDRMALKIASIAVCAEIVDSYFGGNSIDVDEIIELLVSADQNSISKIPLSQKVFEEFESFVSMHNSNFTTITHLNDIQVKNSKEPLIDSYPSKGKHFGEIHIKDDDSYVLIISTVFEQFLKDNKFTEKRAILNDWENQNRIVRGQKDRFVFKPTKNGGMSCNYYKIIMQSLNGGRPKSFGLMVDSEVKQIELKQIKDEIEIEKKTDCNVEVPTISAKFTFESSKEEIDEIFRTNERGE